MNQNRTLHQQFRDGTHQWHAQLDSQPVLSVLARDLNSDEYGLALKALYPAHKGLEDLIESSAHPELCKYGYKPRHALLAGDLTSMDHILPEQAEPPAIASQLCELIGILYVLEGSKLGSQFICRNIQNQSPQWPISFFNITKSEAGTWKSFWLFAEEHLQTPESIDRSIASAIKAFEFYIEQIKRIKMPLI